MSHRIPKLDVGLSRATLLEHARKLNIDASRAKTKQQIIDMIDAHYRSGGSISAEKVKPTIIDAVVEPPAPIEPSDITYTSPPEPEDSKSGSKSVSYRLLCDIRMRDRLIPAGTVMSLDIAEAAPLLAQNAIERV